MHDDQDADGTVGRLAPVAGTPLTRTDGTPVRVLVVDDEHALAEAVGLAFAADGWAVQTVHRGRDVLFAARAGQPDVIVLDVMLPAPDGLALLRHARERRLATPVLMLTARSGVADRVGALDLGADDYLVKPFSARELLARVGSLVQIARLRRESERAIRASERI